MTERAAKATTSGTARPGIAEADDVGFPVAGGVAHEPGMAVHPPAAGVVAEVVDDQVEWCLGPVGLGAGDVDAGVAQADDVRTSVAGGVGHEPGMLVDASATGVVAEVVDDKRGSSMARRANVEANAAAPRKSAIPSVSGTWFDVSITS